MAPPAMVKEENNQLYSEWGMHQIALALKPGGRAAVWSACPDVVIERRLMKAGPQGPSRAGQTLRTGQAQRLYDLRRRQAAESAEAKPGAKPVNRRRA